MMLRYAYSIKFGVMFLKNFQVTVWPEEDYGKFFSGDSYIILNVSHRLRSCVCYSLLPFTISSLISAGICSWY